MTRKTRLFPVTAILAAALLTASAVLWIGCSVDQSQVTAPSETTGLLKLLPDQATDVAKVMAVQDNHAPALMRIDGVVGTATGLGRDGNLAVLVYTKRADVAGVPASLDNIPVSVVVSGEPRAHALKGRYRPVPIGVSVGNNRECAAGTIGCVVLKGSNKYILSNNHVLAMSNAGNIGDDIVQPGRYDNKPLCANKVATDKVADLSDFEPIKFGGQSNTYDAAIAQYSTTDVTCSTPAGYYGFPGSTVVTATLGLPIKKVGRTTSLTTGTVVALNWSGNIGYPSGTAFFSGQIITSNNFDKSGDSGSLVVTNNSSNNPVALLFAGFNNGQAIVSPIAPVFSRFAASVCTN